MSKPRIEDGLVVGNTFDKYNARNPLARMLVRGFFEAFDSLVTRTGARSALEVGCGEGELSLRLARRGLEVTAADISPSMTRIASSRAAAEGLKIEFFVSDLMRAVPPGPPPDLLVCCEVLEHLADPEQALTHLRAKEARHYLFSVPREPIWRALNVTRGRYLPHLGNTPGHVQHWSGRGFRRVVSRHFDVMDVRSPLPWTMVLARARGPK